MHKEPQTPEQIKHLANIAGSRLLLGRLRDLHYEHAPKAFKDGFLPVPLGDALKQEYTKQENKRSGITRALAEIDGVIAALRKVPIKLILAVVTRYYNLPAAELLGSSRNKKASIARFIVYFLARDISGYSFNEIGRRIGDRDHTSIRSGYLRLIEMMRADNNLAMQVEVIRAQVLGHFEAAKINTGGVL